MRKPIQISIPQPCHEKWADMTPADKGRFCTSCQKTVIDFTRASDREIAQVLRSDKQLCGRFIPTQLDRDLVVPKEKGSLWAAASAAVLTFLTMGSNEASAQTIETEQTDKNTQPETFTLTGVVSDETGPLPGATVLIKDSTISTQTDIEGTFLLKVSQGDVIIVSYNGYLSEEVTIINKDAIAVMLKEDNTNVILFRYKNTSSAPIVGAITTINIEDIIAQSELRTITGVVSDNNGPLPGASIIIKGTQVSAQSDIDGNYTIEAYPGAVLEFSYIDFETKEVIVDSNIKICVELSGMLTGEVAVERTFFGRIFHSIGNWFRNHS